MRKRLAVALFCLIVISCQGTFCRLISKFTDPLKQLDSAAHSSLVSDIGSSDSIPAVVQQNDGKIKSNPVQIVLKPVPAQNNIFHKLIGDFDKLSPLKQMGDAKLDVEYASTTPVLEPTSGSTGDESSTPTDSAAPFGSSSEACGCFANSN